MPLKLIFWNVAHGNACLIITPNGKRIAHDLGTNNRVSSSNKKKVFSPLKYINKSHRDRKDSIDAVIITHPHMDHLDDIERLEEFDIKRHIVRPRQITLKDLKENLPDYIAKKEIDPTFTDGKKIIKYADLNKKWVRPHRSKNSPFHPEGNGGVYFKFFRPDFPTYDFNNNSIVTLLSYRGNKIILPGDNEQKSWEQLLKKKEFKNKIDGTTVLLAPHHGWESGFHEKLFEYINTKLTVISDRPNKKTDYTDIYKNKNGQHPVYQKNKRLGKKSVVSTKECNSISVNCFDNGKLRVNVKAGQ